MTNLLIAVGIVVLLVVAFIAFAIWKAIPISDTMYDEWNQD